MIKFLILYYFHNFFRFEKGRIMKLELAKSIQKFNYKPDQGINHLLTLGYCKPDE